MRKKWIMPALAMAFIAVFTSTGRAATGDVNNNGKTEMNDAIMALQAASGIRVNMNAGLPEAVTALRVLAGIYSGEVVFNDLGMEFIKIPAGTFMMGSTEGDPNAYSSEFPQHQVFMPSFYIQTKEVTQHQWEAVMGYNPSFFQHCGSDCPVDQVSWNEVKDFITAMNQQGEGTYRLPAEAEWEYAARAGTTTHFYFGNCLSTDQANYNRDEPLPGCPPGIDKNTTMIAVGSLAANRWRLYDMHGNVWEWVEDDWHDSYTGAPVDGSAWVDNPRGASRVLRGGSWSSLAWLCRSAHRVSDRPDLRNWAGGFRLVLVPNH